MRANSRRTAAVAGGCGLPTKRHARHIQPAPRRAHDQIVSRFQSVFTNRVIEGHGNACRTCVTPFLHDGVRALHRRFENLHHLFNRAQIHLRKEKKSNIINLELTLCEHIANHSGPTFDVYFRRILLREAHLVPAAFAEHLFRYRHASAARIDAHVI